MALRIARALRGVAADTFVAAARTSRHRACAAGACAWPWPRWQSTTSTSSSEDEGALPSGSVISLSELGEPTAPARRHAQAELLDDTVSHISGHDKYGFTVNGIHMRGSVLVFRNFTLLWSVSRVRDVCVRTAAPVAFVRPHVRTFIIGTGDTIQNIDPSMYAFFQRKGISVEVLSTPAAIAAFNLLTSEGRAVAVGLCAHTPMTRDDACVYSDELAADAEKAAERLAERVAESEGRAARPALPGDVDAAHARAHAPTDAPQPEPPSVQETLAAVRDVPLRYGYPTGAPSDPAQRGRLTDPVRAAEDRERIKQARTAMRNDMERALAERNMRRSGAPGKK